MSRWVVDEKELALFICSRFKTNMQDATAKVGIFLNTHGSLVTRTEVKKQECAMHNWVTLRSMGRDEEGYVCGACGRIR